MTGLSPENEDDGDGGGEDNYRTAVDFVSKNFEYTAKAGASQDMSVMDKHFHGYVRDSFSIATLSTRILSRYGVKLISIL